MPSGCATGARRSTARRRRAAACVQNHSSGAGSVSEMQEAEASMAEDKGVPVVRLDCSEVKKGLCELAALRGDGGLEGADGARAQEGVGENCEFGGGSGRPTPCERAVLTNLCFGGSGCAAIECSERRHHNFHRKICKAHALAAATMSSEEEPAPVKEEDLRRSGRLRRAGDGGDGKGGVVRHTRKKGGQTASKVACIAAQGVDALKLTLSAKLLEKPLDKAVITPFLGAYNKKKSTQVAADALECVTIDGFTFKANLPHLATAPCGSLFTSATHEIELHRSLSAPDISDSGAADNATTAATAATSNNAPAAAAAATSAVERVIAAKHEFEILELPLTPQSQSAVRKAYRLAERAPR